MNNYEVFRQSACAFTLLAAEKLREKKEYYRLVTLWIQSGHLVHYEAYYYRHETQVFIYPTQGTHEIIQAAVALFYRLWLSNVKASKSGMDTV